MDKILLEQLLDKISEQQTAKAEINSEYNIFYALRIWSKEVTLHSRIIVDLLNPNGYHGMGTKFLNLFIKELGLDEKFSCEEVVEVVDEKAIQGQRRIDIFLKDSTGNVIVIENKIYACDQKEQLIDYHTFGKSQIGEYGELSTLYLTLNGTNPSAQSIGELSNKDYQCISYSKEIINWINQCIDNSIEKPQLQEVLKQYLQTIEYLTQNNMNNSLEILGLVKDQSQYESLIQLASEINNLQNTVPTLFVDRLLYELKECDIKVTDLEEKAYWIDTEYSTVNDAKIWFKIVPDKKPWCGFVEYDDKEINFSQETKELLNNSGVEGDSNAKYYWWYISDRFNMSNMTLDDIKKLLGNESPDKVIECAKFIESQINKFKKYAISQK